MQWKLLAVPDKVVLVILPCSSVTTRKLCGASVVCLDLCRSQMHQILGHTSVAG